MSAAIRSAAILSQHANAEHARHSVDWLLAPTAHAARQPRRRAMRALVVALISREHYRAALAEGYLDGARVRLAALWPELAANAEPIPTEAMKP